MKTSGCDPAVHTGKCRAVHPFHLALRWRAQMDADNHLTQAKIAARERISRARVTQVMNLLQLPQAIQEALLHPIPPFQIWDFSERRLRALLSDGDNMMQLRQWERWLRELKIGGSQ